MGPLDEIIGKARDWWRRDDSDGLSRGGPALDPAYNGWYVTAIPQGDLTDSAEDGQEPTGPTDDH